MPVSKSAVFFNIAPKGTGFLGSWAQFVSSPNLEDLGHYPDIDSSNTKSNKIIKILLFYFIFSNKEGMRPKAYHAY